MLLLLLALLICIKSQGNAKKSKVPASPTLTYHYIYLLMQMASFIPFAVLSGIFASLSSVFAKLFSDTRTEIFHDAVTSFITKQEFIPIPWTIDPQVPKLAIVAW